MFTIQPKLLANVHLLLFQFESVFVISIARTHFSSPDLQLLAEVAGRNARCLL